MAFSALFVLSSARPALGNTQGYCQQGMLSSSQDEGVGGGSMGIDALFPTELPHSEVFFGDSREVQSIAGGWSQHSRLRK